MAHTVAINQGALCPQLARADIMAERVDSGFDPGCVKTLRGMIAPEILRRVVMFRAKKCRNSSSARHDDQIRFRFHTTKVESECGAVAVRLNYICFRPFRLAVP